MNKEYPIIAYTVAMENTVDGPGYSAESQAYGLEMTIDDEWLVNILMMAPPPYLSYIDTATIFPTEQVAIGASYATGSDSYGQIVQDKGSWVLARRGDDLDAIVGADLGVLLYIDLYFDKEEDLVPLFKSRSFTSENLIVAFQTSSATAIEKTVESATLVKEILVKCGLVDIPILVSIGFDDKK